MIKYNSLNEILELYIGEESSPFDIFGDIRLKLLDNTSLRVPRATVKEDGNIVIQGLQWNKLNTRLKKLYKEKNMFALFTIIYKGSDLEKYKAKKIPRSRMRIDHLEIESFFALEAYLLFMDLYDKYKFEYYKSIAETIYNKTWINKQYPIHTKVDLNKVDNEIIYTLQPYQAEFIKQYPEFKDKYRLTGYLLAFDQGLGKTLTSISLSLALNKDYTIIICPNSLKGNWMNEIKEYFKKYTDDNKLFQDEVYAIKESKWNPNIDKIKYLIINMESIPSVYKYLPKDKKDYMMIVDESHNFRNIESKRVNDMIKLKTDINCKDNLLMSGTPIKALPKEMVPVLRMIDPLFTEKAALKYEKLFDVEGLNTSKLVIRRFSRFMHRKTKDEVLSLPDKTIKEFPLKLKDSNKYILQNVKDEVMDLFGKYYNEEIQHRKKYFDNFINQLVKYKKLIPTNEYNGYYKFIQDEFHNKLEGYHETDLEKWDEFSRKVIQSKLHGDELKSFKRAETLARRLKSSCMGRAMGQIIPKYRQELFIKLWDEHEDNFIKAINDNEKKTVIFSSLLNVVKHINERLNKRKIGSVMVVGEVKDRTDVIQQFKKSDDIDVIVASSQTLSTGVTLTEASQMFFFGTPWRDADFQQCCDRIYRIGQTVDVFIYTIVLDTGDEKNLSSRMNDILNWSNEMFTGFVTGDKNSKK